MDKQIEEAYAHLLSRPWGDVPRTPTYEANVKQYLPKLREDLQNHAHLGVAEKLSRLLYVLHDGVGTGHQTNFAENLQELKVFCQIPRNNTPAIREAILLIVLGSMQGAQSCADMIAKITAEHKNNNMSSISDERTYKPRRSNSQSRSHPQSMHEKELENLFASVKERYKPFTKENSNHNCSQIQSLIELPFLRALRLASEDELPDDLLNFVRAQAEHGISDGSGHSQACDLIPHGQVRKKCEHIAMLFDRAIHQATLEMSHTALRDAALQDAEEKDKRLQHEREQEEMVDEEANRDKEAAQNGWLRKLLLRG